ncbi:aldehyde dehydrogenase family protein, partial [Streptomyces syringium]|uniref:aldehyde dehydrogenase family protein n=1 Tax=Streptomyces syringium TaxID=76729 RepID=UPI00365CD1AC
MHEIINPATEEVIATVSASTPQDVDAAVVRASAAQRAWAARAPRRPAPPRRPGAPRRAPPKAGQGGRGGP